MAAGRGRAGVVSRGPAAGAARGAGAGPGGGGGGGGKAKGAAKGGGALGDLARGGALNLIGTVVSAAATLGVTVLVTRKFATGEAGAFFTAMSAFMIVESICTLGTNVGLVYFIAQLRSLREEDRIPRILRAAEIPVIVVSIVLTAAMILFAGPLAHGMIASHPGRHVTVGGVTDAIRGLAATIPFASQIDLLTGATRGYGDMRPTVAISSVGSTVGQLIGVLIAATLSSSALLAPLWAVPYIPLAAAAWWWLRRISRRSGQRRVMLPEVPEELAALMALATPQPTAPGTPTTARRVYGSSRTVHNRIMRRKLANANPRGFWRFTVPRGAAILATTIVQRLDIVLVAIMKGPYEAAIYTAATRILVLGQFTNTAISRASQPRLTELFTLQDRKGTNVVYQATTGWLVLLTWPLYLLALVYGSQVLGIFGHTYNAGYSVLVVLSLAQLAAAAFGQVDVVLVTSGKSSWSLMNGLLVLCVNVGLDFWLIPKHGIFGAAIAWAIAIIVSNVVPLIQLGLVYRLHPVGRGSMIASTLSLVCFLAVPFGIKMALGASWAALIASAALGFLLMVGGVLRFRRSLKLQGMPGISVLARRWPSLMASRPGQQG